ncbi:AIG2-like protein D [Hondaea fermentalgiana]|uniref:Putative gamma-glutamylcyclotransferase n=1 Tax=Hondaea fermentalgiana TaxID=2315210 RepID=A0A2R5G1P9_9STRA|nr:AIG2-like protein D [Hondaea fermentalgiana]|eukprot:GBG24947.1 AIG2-like protein D [Hondaea fermentalgiana]
MNVVFVYGSLMEERVLSTVVGRMPAFQPGLLLGYTRYAIKDRVYPGIRTTKPDDKVTGLLVSKLSDEEIRRLDSFEDDDYDRVEENIFTENGEAHRANVYVWKKELEAELKPTLWDYDKDFMPHVEEYVANSKRFAEHGYSWDFDVDTTAKE